MPTADPAGATVLVIEDDVQVRRLLVQALSGEGYRLVEAGSGNEALARLEKVTPDLLIVDIMLPEIDGVSLVQKVKARPETRDVPVIFLTGRLDPQAMADGIDAGARYYVTKPFALSDLLAKVSRALGGHGKPGR